MAKCKRCGKSGLFFFKVNASGLCQECERIEILKAQEHKLLSSISELDKRIDWAKLNLEDTVKRQDNIYREINEKAKHDALVEIANRIAEQEQQLVMISTAAEAKTQHVNELTTEEVRLDKSILLAANKLKKIQSLFKAMQYSVSRYQNSNELSQEILSDDSVIETDDVLETTIKLKFHLMDIRELKKAFQQNQKITKELLATYKSRYTTKTNATIYKLMVIALEAELQNVLYNLNFSKLEKSIKDIRGIISKYQQIASDGNQSIAPTIAKFIGELEYLFIETVKIEYEYYIQKERIKEEQKMLREQMRQEAAEKKRLEEERRKVEQEESKYKSEISQIFNLIEQTTDQSRIQQLHARIEKVQSQLEEVEKKKDSIITLQNGKAGYIYIISNLGSFGENIYKIGMTRRLDPQERIDELGGASVPFRFDVHSFIFSNSAPDLEYSLHKKLHNQRVNKVNLRKEFFRTTIDELENLVYELEPTASFNRTMLAEQFYQSTSIEFIPDSVVTDFADDIEELDDELG